jgi:hypothetical protein
LIFNQAPVGQGNLSIRLPEIGADPGGKLYVIANNTSISANVYQTNPFYWAGTGNANRLAINYVDVSATVFADPFFQSAGTYTYDTLQVALQRMLDTWFYVYKSRSSSGAQRYTFPPKPGTPYYSFSPQGSGSLWARLGVNTEVPEPMYPVITNDQFTGPVLRTIAPGNSAFFVFDSISNVWLSGGAF